MLLTIPQASEPRASMLQLSLTIVLSRRQPSWHLCGSRSVMDCFGTDNLSLSRDVQPSTLPHVSTTAMPAHQLLFVVRDLTSFVANTTSVVSSAMCCNKPDPDMWIACSVTLNSPNVFACPLTSLACSIDKDVVNAST